MFKENGQIYKIDAKGSFIDIREAFLLGDGKVVFQFRTYDKNKPVGNRTTGQTDFYMDIEDFSYLCHILKTGRIIRMLQEQIQKAKQSGSKYPAPGYAKLGGTCKDGKVISRQLKIEGGGENPIFIKALQGPGEKTQTGMIKPCYNDTNAQVKITLKISEEDLTKIGLCGERAINNYFDRWVADGVLEEKVKALQFTASNQTAEKQKPQEAVKPTQQKPVASPAQNKQVQKPLNEPVNVEDRF